MLYPGSNARALPVNLLHQAFTFFCHSDFTTNRVLSAVLRLWNVSSYFVIVLYFWPLEILVPFWIFWNKIALSWCKTASVVRECTVWHVRPTKTQNSMRISRVWSVFVVRKRTLCSFGYPKCAQWRFWPDCANAQAMHSEDSCQTVRIYWLVLIFAGLIQWHQEEEQTNHDRQSAISTVFNRFFAFKRSSLFWIYL